MRLSLRYVAAAIVLPACGGAPSRAPELAAPAPVARTSASGVTAVQASPIGKMARIPSATFRMGSEAGERDEAPVHPVRVAAFDLDVTEVTVAEYAACVKAGACVPAPAVVQWPGVTGDDQQLSKDMCNENRLDRQDHAVNCVDWNLADAYCRWADKRLPTEEEWEYAACGGVCNEETSGPKLRAALATAARWPFTSRVASGSIGPFGLYDMAGNVWEWTASAYCPYDHPGCGDPRRVIRGGSWSMIDYLFVRLTDRSASVALDEKHEPRLPLRAKPGHGNDTPVLEQTMSNPDTTDRRPFIIVLGLDLTDTKSSGFALDQAARIASRIEPSQVHAVYALPEDASDAIAREAVGLTQTYVNGKVAALAIQGPVLGVHVRRGDPAREVAQVAAELDADMIIVGTHKVPHLKTLFVGSTAERVMANARCPVLVAGPRPPPEAPHVIVIEAPCPDCVRRRNETGNREFWCEQHTATRFLRRHVYSYSSETPFGSADMSVAGGGDNT